MNLDAFLRDVYVPLRLRGRSRNSVRLLEHAVRQFGRWLGRPAMLDDFEDLTVARFLAARGERLAPASVARERSGLVALWALAHRRGLVPRGPCVSPEVVPQKTPRAFTAEELGKLDKASGMAEGWVGPVPAAVWFRALLAVCFESGERIGALLATPRECWMRPFLTVPAIVRKGGKAEKIYEFSARTEALLDAASDHNGPTVFWWPCSGNALRKRWRTITRRAGVGEGRDVQFHAIRRSTASHLAAAGLDATAFLGHSSDRVTRRSYLDPRIVLAARPRVVDALPRIGEAG